MVEHREVHSKQKLITPAVRRMKIDVFIFVATGLDPNVTPATEVNNLLDTIDPTSGGVLAPSINGRQTLGNLVTDCYIDGDIVKAPGDFDGSGVLIIPVEVVFMQP